MIKRIQNFQLLSIQSISSDGIQYIKAKQTNSQSFFTLKKIKINNQTQKTSNIGSEVNNYETLCNKLLQQANVLNILSHQSIPKFHKILRTKQNLYLAYDYHPSNNLVTYFQKARPTFSEKIKLAKKMCQILMFIHSKNIILKELRPESILINKKGQIFFTGFQQSIIIKPEQQQITVKLKLEKKNSIKKSNNKLSQISYKGNIFDLGNIFKQIFKFKNLPSLYLTKKQSQFREVVKIVQTMTSKNQEEIPEIQMIIQILNKNNSQYNSTQASQGPFSPTLSNQCPQSPNFTAYTNGLSNLISKKSISNFSRQNKKSVSPVKTSSKIKILTKSTLPCSFSITQKMVFDPKQCKQKDEDKQFGKIIKQRNSIIFLIQMSKFSLQFKQQQLSKLLIKISLALNQGLNILIKQVKPKTEQENNILSNFMNQANILEKINIDNNIVPVNKLKRLKSLNSLQVRVPDYIQKINKKQQNKLLNSLIIQFGTYLIELLQRKNNQIKYKKQNQILKKYYYLSSKIKYGTFQDFFTLKMTQGQKQLWKNTYFVQFQKNQYSNQKLSGQIIRRIQKWKQNQEKN